MLKETIEQCLPHANPLARPDYTEAEAQALRACNNGEATPRQQKMVIDYILRAAGTQDMPFDPDGRFTDFRCGMMHVGQTILWMLAAAPTKTDPDKIATRKVEIPDGGRPDQRW